MFCILYSEWWYILCFSFLLRVWGLCLDYYYYFLCRLPVVSAPFVEKIIFTWLYCMYSFFQRTHIYVRFPLWTLCSVPLVYVYSSATSTPFWLLELYSKSWSQVMSVLWLYSLLSLLCWLCCVFPIHIKFRIISLIFTKQLACGVGEDSWESLGQHGVKPVIPKGNQSWVFNFSWNSNTLAMWCKKLTHLKKPWG